MIKLRGFEIVKDSKRVNSGEIRLPKRASIHSAGYDFYMPRDVTIKANSTSEIIFFDVKAYMFTNEFLQIHIRSSLGVKRGINLANGTGIIDRDYYNNPDNDGNIGLSFRNNTNEDVHIKRGERVAQGIFMEYATADNSCVNEEYEERTGGFGSSGK